MCIVTTLRRESMRQENQSEQDIEEATDETWKSWADKQLQGMSLQHQKNAKTLSKNTLRREVGKQEGHRALNTPKEEG